ncbi:hypothetical protein M0657_009478 [Pyricularia oryzae]|nr:hypothetical protein OOU_Y34scaffold00069g6 [Pyricularia oryzae Y34]KAI7914434.1 hypothetical protein M0657_009478 [Pyricularia oryzae]KAI7922733.1 hypothetical protein M9X92_004704 [Pyricularia oryzae]
MRFSTSFAVKTAVLVLCATESTAAPPKYTTMCMVHVATPWDPTGNQMKYQKKAPSKLELHLWDNTKDASDVYRGFPNGACEVQMEKEFPSGYRRAGTILLTPMTDTGAPGRYLHGKSCVPRPNFRPTCARALAARLWQIACIAALEGFYKV